MSGTDLNSENLLVLVVIILCVLILCAIAVICNNHRNRDRKVTYHETNQSGLIKKNEQLFP